MSSVGRLAPSIDVYFNKDLSESNLSVVDNQGIVNTPKIHGKMLEMDFSKLLKIGSTHTITIAHIESTGGDVITNKNLTFTVKDVAVQKMSSEQQNKLIARQDKFTYSLGTINFVNFDQLIDRGIQQDQLTTIETAIFNYSKVIKKEFNKVILDSSSLVKVLHDPAAQTYNNSSMTFTTTIDSTTYTVRAEYPSFGDDIYTRIYDTGGAIVFDSSTQ